MPFSSYGVKEIKHPLENEVLPIDAQIVFCQCGERGKMMENPTKSRKMVKKTIFNVVFCSLVSGDFAKLIPSVNIAQGETLRALSC